MSVLSLDEQEKGGAIAWMVKNPVVPNILMTILLIGGILIARQTKQEAWPELTSAAVSVTVAYPGASADEVEQGILFALEDSTRGIDGVKRVVTHAFEGLGSAEIQLRPTANSFKVFQDVKNAVDRIQTFPSQAEKPEFNFIQGKEQVLSVIVYGKQSYQAIRTLAERVRDDLSSAPGASSVSLGLAPPYEISIEVPLAKLRAYNLSLDRIASLIRESNVNLPGGEIHADSGRILLRTQERRDYGKEFGEIPVTTSADGSIVKLQDIASIRDGFEEGDVEALFNQFPAVSVEIFRAGNLSPQELSRAVNDYIKRLAPEIPPNTHLQIWNDTSEGSTERVTLLRHDALLGFFLILVLLGCFLEIRVAFLVTLCIPVSLFGAFFILQFTPMSINLISIFALIVALGIVIDYSIVMGESIYRKREEGLNFLQAAQAGAHEMAKPVLFAVCTNAVAFLPMLFIPGTMGKLFAQIPIIAIAVFTISLFEVLFILPSHLALKPGHSRILDILNRPKLLLHDHFLFFLAKINIPIVNFVLRHRYSVLGIAVGLLVLSGALIYSGIVPFTFFPRADSNLVTFQVELPFGAPIEETKKVRDVILQAALDVSADLPDQTIKGVYSQIGAPLTIGFTSGSHIVGASVNLVSSNYRTITSSQFGQRWRKKVGSLPGAKRLIVTDSDSPDQATPIEVHLSHPMHEQLETAAKELFQVMGRYRGVVDVSNGIQQGKRQLDFHLSPEARSLGITPYNFGLQIRSAFFGTEALRQLRGQNMIKIMLRLPKDERSTLETLKNMVIFTPQGGEISLAQAATFTEQRSYLEIQRQNGQRVLVISANVDPDKADTKQIVESLATGQLPALVNKYPGLSYTLGGEHEEQDETLGALRSGFVVVLLAIYTLLAIPFKSYLQPFIVLISIPFGAIGAIIGHLILGYSFSVMSLLGIIALSGVVVNSSLLMIVTANGLRQRGFSALAAVRQAEITRFRPILLTALTTFLSVAPIILESGIQARSLVPMAISLGFGILFTTLISLGLVPALYLILEDINIQYKASKG